MFDYLYKAKSVLVFGESAKLPTQDLALQVVDKAKNKNITIGCAESITSGMISAAITSVSGSSEVFLGGINSYAYSVKNSVLGVSNDLLENVGAVNAEVAKQMAQGAKKSIKCDLAISITGIAGPNSDEFNTPVGTVFIGLCSNNISEAKEFHLKGNRQQIRESATNEALRVILNYI